MYLVLLPIIELFTIKLNRYNKILEIQKNKFPTDRPIAEKQGRGRPEGETKLFLRLALISILIALLCKQGLFQKIGKNNGCHFFFLNLQNGLTELINYVMFIQFLLHYIYMR